MSRANVCDSKYGQIVEEQELLLWAREMVVTESRLNEVWLGLGMRLGKIGSGGLMRAKERGWSPAPVPFQTSAVARSREQHIRGVAAACLAGNCDWRRLCDLFVPEHCLRLRLRRETSP